MQPKDNKKKSFVITGGAGFLGQHVIYQLLKQYPDCIIKVIDLKYPTQPTYSFEKENRVIFYNEKDVTKPETYLNDIKEGADCLFNLVGYISFWSKEKDELYRLNVESVKKTLESAAKVGIKKVVHVSSVAAIGYTNDKLNPADESLHVEWERYKRKHYMYTKHLGEMVAKNFINDKMDVVIINPSLMYGPGDTHNIITLFKSLLKGQIPFYTPGGNSISDVRDVAAGLVAAYERGQSGERYILAADHQSFENIFKLIADALGVQPPKICLPCISKFLLTPFIKLIEILSLKRPILTADTFTFGFLYRYHSSAKAKRELAWLPQISSAQSMRDTAGWYLKEGLI